ncbi:MAG: radical SAM protein [Nanoarchaeota archaeon]|nr:radical SAM protein [Nanoarchaeota archaeon]
MKIVDSMRILLTEDCNANCPHCFNKNLRNSGHMNTERARILFDYLSKHISRIKFMGGEPTLHPDFIEIYQYAQKRFSKVSLFTNALNDKILEIIPRPNDVITYNLIFINKNFNLEKLLPSRRFLRGFETMIGTDTDMSLLLEKVEWLAKRCEEKGISEGINFNITLNCTEDIFEHRGLLNEKWRTAVQFLYEINPSFVNFDHSIPLCFWTEESRDFLRRRSLMQKCFYRTCRPGCYGLINADFELLHCNQYPIKLGNIFQSKDDNTKIISFNRLNALLYKTNMEKLLTNLNNDACINCRYAVVNCTGGCFRHKSQETNKAENRKVCEQISSIC